MTDHTGILLQEMGLGCFVGDWQPDAPTPSREILYDSLRYLRAFWEAREQEFRMDFDGMVRKVSDEG